jgi:hypothetical protein
MPLIERLKEFGLDAELIDRDREISEGLAEAHYEHARALPDSDEPQEGKNERYFAHMMAAATEYRRAGAHAILMSDNKAAEENFYLAAIRYNTLDRPYGLMMFSCGTQQMRREAASIAFQSAWLERVERTQLPYVALMIAGYTEYKEPEQREQLAHIVQALEASQKAPIGVLGIPSGSWLDLAKVLGAKSSPREAILQALMPFLATYSAALRRCAADEYHWRRLAFPFHPAEPDILGVVFLVEDLLRRWEEDSLLKTLPEMHLDGLATDLLIHAIEDRFEERGRQSDRS